MSIDDAKCSLRCLRKVVDTFKLLSLDDKATFMALHRYTTKNVKSKHEEDRVTHCSSGDDKEGR